MFLRHVEDGAPAAPALVLGSSIGTSHQMWDPLIGELSSAFRVIRFDAPGHGGSHGDSHDSPGQDGSHEARLDPIGPFGIADIADGVVELADRLGVTRFAYAGLSMGGAVGQQIALDHPARVTSLVLCCTSAWFGGPQSWLERAARVRAEGTGWLVEASRPRWFRPDVELPAGGAELLAAQQDLDPAGYAACCEALAAFDTRDRLGEIGVPTRVIAGADDVATPLAMAQALAAGIRSADLVVVPGAAHLASVEQPGLVLEAMMEHLKTP